MNTNYPIILTHHAIDRFRTRHVPHMTHAEASRELSAYLPDAVKIEEKSLLGQDQWLIQKPYGVILVCKNDPTTGIVAVTSIPESWRGPSAEDLEEVREASVRAALAAVAALPKREPRVYVKKSKAVDPEKQARAIASMAANVVRMAEASKAAKEKRAAKEAHGEVIRDKMSALSAQADLHRAKVERMKRERIEQEAFMNADRYKLRNMLRMLLLAVEPFTNFDMVAAEAWDSIAESDPGLVSDQFLAWRPE